MDDVTILHGDALTMLRTLPDASVHCICSSPPYYGLRAYLPAGHADKALEIGAEPTVGAYVARLVAVFAECWRVLRDDGTLWLNLGDSYYHDNPSGPQDKNGQRATRTFTAAGAGGIREGRRESNLKPKDLIGVPWRVAFALQDAGWWLRSDIIWAKTAPMPESVTDRPTRSHEYIFLLTKRARYFYDNEAVKEPKAESTVTDPRTNDNGHRRNRDYIGSASNGGTNLGGADGGRNQRDVWTLGPEPYAAAHFATFPTEIPRRAILAGTSERGCCPACGAPWARVVERTAENHISRQDRQIATGGAISGGVGKNFPDVTSTTTGWRPTCKCDAGDPIPCTVLDPFGGSGTTAAVAVGLGRRAILCELNADYIELARDRIAAVQRPLSLNL